ncbi:MAG: ACP phosphodiesterase [Verrucomicrobiales bacterium]|nr:ACP phosphodiesterase [Verrucomicrobiales bacterium]
MNLLAHLHLSEGRSPDILTANVLADYLGRYDSVDLLPEKVAERLMPGILLHRQIDSFTDQHAVVAKARDLVSPERRRLAGIIVDIAFDYYLTRHWEKFSSEDKDTTISRGYATMAMVASTGLSRKTQGLISKMRAHNWLSAYGTLEGQALTYQRVSRVTPAVANLRGAEEEIVKKDREFDQYFLEFYPELKDNILSFTV